MNRDKAERRVETIAGFRQELKRLEETGILKLDAEQRRAVRAYHDEVLEDLAGQYEIDAEAPPAWGMRIATTVGALFVAGLVLAAVDAVWNELMTWAQAAVAIAAPLLLVGLAEALRATGRSRYFVGLAALFAVAAFILDLRILTLLFNMPFGLLPWLAAGVFGAALGHRYGLAPVVAVGLVVAGASLAGLVALADGAVLAAFLDRQDPLFAIGLAIYLVGTAAGRLGERPRQGYRAAGLLLMAGALLLLGYPTNSMLPLSPAVAGALYQAVGLIGGLGLLALGLARGWRESTYGALLFLILLVLTRLDAWFGRHVPDAADAVVLAAAAALFVWLARLIRGVELARQEG